MPQIKCTVCSCPSSFFDTSTTPNEIRCAACGSILATVVPNQLAAKWIPVEGWDDATRFTPPARPVSLDGRAAKS